LRQKIIFFFNFRGRREHFWGISCEKSRFCAKKSYFFPILGGRAPGAPPPFSFKNHLLETFFFIFGILSGAANFFINFRTKGFQSHHKEDCVFNAHAHVAVELSVLAIINYF
jgi:hypothetical protein